MKVMDERAGEVFVAGDRERFCVEMQIGETAAQDSSVIRLTRREARRLAALLLFQAARLDRLRETWGLPHLAPERKTA